MLIGAIIQHHFAMLRVNRQNRCQNEVIAMIKIKREQGIALHDCTQDEMDLYFRMDAKILNILFLGKLGWGDGLIGFEHI